MFPSKLAPEWHMYTCPLLFPPLLHLIPFCHSISPPSLCYSSRINVSWGRSPYPSSSWNNVLQIRPGDYMTHHSVAFTSDCASWQHDHNGQRPRGLKKTKTNKKGTFCPKNCLSSSVGSQSIIKGFIPYFRCERLKWVTRYDHCNIAVNIHKLIII